MNGKSILVNEKEEILNLINSIISIIRNLECLILNFKVDENNLSSISELFTKLDNYKTIVPPKYQKAFLKHYIKLKNDYAKKILDTKSHEINCSENYATFEAIKSVKSEFSHISYLLVLYQHNEFYFSSIKKSFKLLSNYEVLIPKRYKKAFFKHLNNLSNEFNNLKDKYENNTLSIKSAKPKKKFKRVAKSTFRMPYFNNKQSRERTSDPFLAKKLRKI